MVRVLESIGGSLAGKGRRVSLFARRNGLWAYAHVMPQCRIGKGCNLGEGVFLETSEPVGEYTVIKNGVSVWERVRLEDRVFVGPAAVFTNDRIPHADPRFKMPGNPARPNGFVCECGIRLSDSLRCRRRYRRKASGLSPLPQRQRSSAPAPR